MTHHAPERSSEIPIITPMVFCIMCGLNSNIRPPTITRIFKTRVVTYRLVLSRRIGQDITRSLAESTINQRAIK